MLARRAIACSSPIVRGYGPTRFLSDDDVRNGQPSRAGDRRHRLHGRAQDPEGDARRLRLGRALGRHRRGALAGALQGPGVGQWLPDRQPGSQARCRCRPRPSCSGGTSSTSPPSAAGRATRRTGTTSPSSSGSSHRRSGSSTTRRSTVAPRRSTTPTTSASSIHNYRWRLGLAQGEPQYDDLEKRLAQGPVITVPTITLEGDANGAPHPDPALYAKQVLGPIHAPDHHRRHRPQPAAGGATRLCPGRGGRRRLSSMKTQQLLPAALVVSAACVVERNSR